jgi:hypothetical protein
MAARLVVTTNRDPDNVGYVPWRMAIYVSGETPEVKNMLMLLDTFVSWRVANETEKPFPASLSVDIRSATSFKLSLADGSDELECRCTLTAVTDTVSPETFRTAIHHAQPPTLKRRIIRADIGIKSFTDMAVVFSGDTWPLRALFDGGSVGGQFVKNDGKPAERGDPDAEYYHVLPAYTFVDAESIVVALQYFTTMLAHTAIAVSWDTAPDEDTLLSEFLDQLSQQPNITVLSSSKS